jgi:hypothetical protein
MYLHSMNILSLALLTSFHNLDERSHNCFNFFSASSSTTRTSRKSLKLLIPLPQKRCLFWGVPPAVGIVGPEDPSPLPFLLEGWVWVF